MLQSVARMVVCKIFKQGEVSGLVHRMGFSSGTGDTSEAAGKKMISLGALLRDRKSLFQTKREKSTPVGTRDDTEKWLNPENKRRGTRSEIVHLCPENNFQRSLNPEMEKIFFK